MLFKSEILVKDFKTRPHLISGILLLFNLPISIAVDVERPGHQDDYHWSNGLPLAIKIVVTQKLELFFGHKKLLQGKKKPKTRPYKQAPIYSSNTDLNLT